MSTEPFDARQLRQVLGSYVTGVTIITTVDKTGKPHGVTANSFSSVSLNPPLVLWSQSVASGSYPAFRDAERFAVSILAEDQVAVSDRFAKAGRDKFAGVNVKSGLGGIPLIDGCAGYLECSKVASYPGGDHAVFLGRVERIDFSARKPLVFGGGKYLVAQPHDLGEFSIDLGMASLAHLQAVRVATRELARLANELNQTIGLAVWGNHGPTIIRWEESKRPVTLNLRTGVVVPVTTSVTGLIFAAYLPKEITGSFVDAEMQQAVASGDDTRTSFAQRLELALAEVRAHGMARMIKPPSFPDTGEINAISAPVFDREGLVVHALTSVAHAAALDADWEATVPRRLKECAASLSRRLGFSG